MDDSATPGLMALVTRLSKRVYRITGEDRLGMRLKDFVAISHLRAHDGMTQQAFGDTLCIDANSLVLLLNPLEVAGLIERRRDPADRRRHLLALTPAGAAALERAEKAMEAVEDDVLGPLSSEERATLRSLLARALADDGVAAGAAGPVRPVR